MCIVALRVLASSDKNRIFYNLNALANRRAAPTRDK